MCSKMGRIRDLYGKRDKPNTEKQYHVFLSCVNINENLPVSVRYKG